jgi:hypothetical protein
LASQKFKITCNTCQRYEYCDYAPSQEQYDEWRCSLCSPRTDGVKRPLVRVTICGQCNQSYDSKEDCPNCGPEIKTTKIKYGKIGDWPETRVTENARQAVESGETILRNRIRNVQEEKAEREKLTLKLLQEQTKLLKKLVRMEKSK